MSHVKFLINITANITIGLYLYKKMEVTDEEIGKKVVCGCTLRKISTQCANKR